MNKNAIARFKVINGVPGFCLFFGEQNYGHYPCDQNRWEESMTAAMADALEYGYYGITFEGGWKAPF